MTNIRQKTEQGIKWSGIDQIFRLVVTIGISAFLARFVAPAEFGLFAMVTIITGFLSVFKDFGLGNVIIYKTDITHREINSIFWVNNGIAGLIGLGLFIGAPWVADFYKEEKLTALTQAMAILFMLGGLGSIPEALIRKNIDFKRLFTINITNQLLSGLIAGFCAYQGLGVWALVIQLYISTLAGTYLSYRMVAWRPKWVKPEWNLLKPFFSYSLPLFGENTINYWVRNIDNLLIGKWLGEQTLGYYSRAYNLMLLPVRQISGAIIRVVFPAFSQVKHDKDKVWTNYKRLLNITSFITFPLMACMYLLGEEIILTVYGKNWLAAVPMFQALCFLGAAQSIGTYCGSIFSSQGRTSLQFKIGLFVKPFLIMGIVTGLYINGIMGLIIGYTLTNILAFFIESYFVMQVLEKKFFLFFSTFHKELICTFVALVISYFLKNQVSSTNVTLNFLIVLLAGGLTYMATAIALKTEGVLFIKEKIYGVKTND